MTYAQSTLDQTLSELAIAAQNPSCSSTERSLLLDQLVEQVWLSKRLCRPHRSRFPYHYDEIYEEAWQNLFLFLCQHIDQYRPEKGSVLAWLNFLMQRRFVFEASRKVLGCRDREVLKAELWVDRDRPASLLEQIRQCLEEDLNHCFQQAHVADFPQANFRNLALWRLDARSWGELSVETGVPISTLSAFYQRQLRKFKAQIQRWIQAD